MHIKIRVIIYNQDIKFTQMSLAEIKKQLIEKYAEIKKIYKSNQITFDIKEKDVDQLYSTTVKALDDESTHRKNRVGKYGLVNSDAIQEKYYFAQLKKISDAFYQKTQSIDPKYIQAIEEEFQMNQKREKFEKLEKKASHDLIDMSEKSKAVALIGGNDKKLIDLLIATGL